MVKIDGRKFTVILREEPEGLLAGNPKKGKNAAVREFSTERVNIE